MQDKMLYLYSCKALTDSHSRVSIFFFFSCLILEAAEAEQEGAVLYSPISVSHISLAVIHCCDFPREDGEAQHGTSEGPHASRCRLCKTVKETAEVL